MRSSQGEGKKGFKYIIDMSSLNASTWIVKDQLRISSYPSIQVCSKVYLRHLVSPTSDKQRHTSQPSRGVSTPADLALGGEPGTWKRGHQGMYIETNSEIDNSVNTNKNHNVCDIDNNDPRPAKRRKSRASSAVILPLLLLGVKKAQNRRHKRSRYSRSPTSEKDTEEDDDDNKTFANSTGGEPPSTARTTPASETAPSIELQLCSQLINADQDWEIRRVIGKENVNGVLYYLVDWCPTLLPEHSLGHAKELVYDFEARFRAQRRLSNDGRSEPRSKVKQKASLKAKTLNGQPGKKPRGRPRKQT